MTSQEGLFYEGRLAKLELSEAERPKIDPDFEEVTEGAEVERKEGLKSKWAQLAAVVGSRGVSRRSAEGAGMVGAAAEQGELRQRGTGGCGRVVAARQPRG